MNVAWTDRATVVGTLRGLIHELEEPAHTRVLAVLAALRCPHPEPFRRALDEAMARGERGSEWLDALARAGGRLASTDAERWLALPGRDDAHVAEVLEPADARAVFAGRIARADADTLSAWLPRWRASPSGSGAATLVAEGSLHLLDLADPTVASHRWALCDALPHPLAARALARRPADEWPPELWQALRNHPYLVDELDPEVTATLARACALPGALLPSRLGGSNAAVATLLERVTRIEAHAAAVTAARASLTIGATTPGVLGSRVKGGHRVRIGPLTAFLPLGRWHGNGPAPVAFRVVKIARTLVVEPAADQVVAPAEVLEPVPLAAQTLATLVTWSGATALVHDALDGPASEQVFDVLLRHRPLRAAAWVSTHRPPHERGWRLRLELGVAAGEAEWIEALEARAPVRQAALRGLRHRPLTPRVVRSLREDGDRIDVGAERLLAEAGEEPWTRLAEIADDDTQRPAVRGAALRCLPPELAVQRCGAWLAHPRLARYAAEALADLGDQASLTMLLRASLDPALPCPSETLSRL